MSNEWLFKGGNTLDYNETSEYKDLQKELTHPWEKATRTINVIIFIGLLLFSIGSIIYLINTGKILSDDVSEFENYGLTFIFLIGTILVLMGNQYAKTRAYSIRISEEQFSDVYEVVKTLSEKLDMGYIPEAYVTQEGGVLNAFATSFFSRRFISINSAIFEVSYLEHKDMDTLSFIIAHELTHLKKKHATTFMSIIEAPAKMIPVWSGISSRVKEYTCDRHAAWLCPEGIDGLILLGIGKHLYKEVNVDAYVEDSNKSYKGIFCWVTNLLASHPVLPKRMKALKNLDKRGEVF